MTYRPVRVPEITRVFRERNRIKEEMEIETGVSK